MVVAADAVASLQFVVTAPITEGGPRETMAIDKTTNGTELPTRCSWCCDLLRLAALAALSPDTAVVVVTLNTGYGSSHCNHVRWTHTLLIHRNLMDSMAVGGGGGGDDDDCCHCCCC